MSGLVIFGTRPEAIKLAPVVNTLRRRLGPCRLQVVTSGQHSEILEQTLGALNLSVDHNLNIMQPNQSPSQVLERAVAGLNKTFEQASVDWVMVQGDTATAFAGALFGYFLKVPVIHLEAGLRTHDLQEPWPEEGLRQNIARLATLHLAPYPRALQNLLDEGIDAANIEVVGNPGLDAQDAAFQAVAASKETARLLAEKFFLVSLHRRENSGPRLRETCYRIQELARLHPDHKVIWPVHPSPRIRRTAIEIFGDQIGQVELCLPFDYPDFLSAQKAAELIISDSGGVQEEAPTYGTGVAVVREKTERTEVVEFGLAKVVGGDARNLIEVADEFLSHPISPNQVRDWRRLQGNGHAAEAASEAILAHLASPYASSARLA